MGRRPRICSSASTKDVPMGCQPGASFCRSPRSGSLSLTSRASRIRRAQPSDERSRERRHPHRSSRRPQSSCKPRNLGASRPLLATAKSRSESDAMRGVRLTILSIAACAASASACQSAVAPMDYLHADGRMGKTILPLTQGLLIISAVVVVIIAALVLIAILRRGRTGVVAGSPLMEGEARDGFRSASACRRSCLSAWSSGPR